MARIASFSLAKNHPNQDHFLAADFGDGRVLIGVADGVGGQPRGDIASSMAVDLAERIFDADFAAQMKSAFHAIHGMVLDEHEPGGEMMSTLTLARIDGNFVSIGHVGDTRAYLLSPRGVRALTADQCRTLIIEGKNNEELSVRRGALTSCLGSGRMEPDTALFETEPGDRLLIVSDGIHDLLPPQRLDVLNAATTGAADLIAALKAEVEAEGIIDDTTAVAYKFG